MFFSKQIYGFISGKCQLFIPEMCKGVLTTFIQACSLNRKRKAAKSLVCTLWKSQIWNPPCLQNSTRKYPPMPSEFQFKKPPLPLEFREAVHGMVQIFSGIAHYVPGGGGEGGRGKFIKRFWHLKSLKDYHQKGLFSGDFSEFYSIFLRSKKYFLHSPWCYLFILQLTDM